MSDLLPPNATPLERRLAQVNASLGDLAVPFRDLVRPATCPEELLPWLASSLSVDSWDPDWSSEQKRETIRNSLQVHRRKGTIGAVKNALAALGYEVQLQEWFNQIPAAAPYTYRLHINVQQIGLDKVGLEKVQKVVAATKNLRSHLDKIHVVVTSRSPSVVATVAGIGREIGIAYAAPDLDLLMEGAANGMEETKGAVDELHTHLNNTMATANYW